MDSTRENDILEIISEAHLEFMRAYIFREEQRSRQAIQRFPATGPRCTTGVWL
jgi:hypothetical protein